MDSSPLPLKPFAPGSGIIYREFLGLLRLDFLPEKWRDPLAFALRNWIACMLALFLAFFLQLDQPYWAAMTIWMVAQPTPGMAISKSVYRIIGTLIGAVMGVVLIALFVQTPELFILALAFWIGGCTLASNLLRGFRAYGAVLAGYTAAIISLGAYATPNQVFYIAIARGTATMIGIACMALMASLFARHEAREKVIATMREALRMAARRGAFPLTGTVKDRIALGRPLVASMVALDTEIDYASAESAEFRIHADLARSLVAHLFALVSAKRSLEDHLFRRGLTQDQTTIQIYEEAMRLLENAPTHMEEKPWAELEEKIEALRHRIQEQAPEAAHADIMQGVSSRIVLDRLDDLLRHFGRAIHDWRGLHAGWHWEPSQTLDFHRDQRSAWINGIRAFLAVLAAGTFWIATAWSSGSSMLIQVGVACSLFSTAPRPDVLGITFFMGGLLASVTAFICNFYFLQFIDGFPLLVLVYGLFLIPAVMRMLDPRKAMFYTAYCVTFITLSRPLNPMNFDAVSFLNNAVATLAGVAFGVLAYLLFMPPDPRAARRYVVWRIRKGLQIISQRPSIPPPCIWQTRMFDRVNRLYDASNPSGTPTDEWYEGGLAALNLGNEVLRLRLLLESGTMDSHATAMVRAVIKSFGEIQTSPDSTRFTIQAVGAALQETPPPENLENRRAWFRSLGIVREMEAFFIEHPGFLTPR